MSHRLTLFIAGLLLAFGCDHVEPERCAEFKMSLGDCLGDEFAQTMCDNLSDSDIANMIAAFDGDQCIAVRDSLPIDGDIESARCRLSGTGCAPAFNPEPTYAPTRYPIVLVNGIDTSPLFRYSERILTMLRRIGGHDVHLAIDTPYEAPQRRAHDLWATIQAVKRSTGAEKVNLICHSLGGLDCRYLVSEGGLHWDVAADHATIAGSVASITTVATAHRGTRIADMALGLVPDGDAFDAANRLATFLGDTFTEKRIEGEVHLRAALQALTTVEAGAFNQLVTDAPNIYYQSFAGFSLPDGVESPGYRAALGTLCATAEGDGLRLFNGIYDRMAVPLIPSTDIVGDMPEQFVPNDGLASVQSARWGRFRGCLPADHMEQLGQYNLPDVNVRTGFDIARFYTNVAGELAEMGY